MPVNIQELIDRNKEFDTEKRLWNNHWQLVGEYCLQRKAHFTSMEEPGAFLHSEIWDTTAPKAVEVAASALLGMMWPDNHSFKYMPVDDSNDQVMEYFERATERVQIGLDDPRNGLDLSLFELTEDLLTFGTSSLYEEGGDETDFIFQSWNVAQFAIDEDADGYVDTFFRTYKMTPRQMVQKFNLPKDQLHKDVLKMHKDGKKTKSKILHVIAPRSVDPKKGIGRENMPVMSIYIDIDRKQLIRESGFEELPAFCVRASKKINEKYGRSAAMRALPDIMELNAVWEAVTVAMEKNLDPPLAVYDDGRLGPGTIDTSAGAINVLNVSGKINGNQRPIEPLFTVGNFNDVIPLIEKLEQSIQDHFMIDRLLDLNNDTQMTAREALIRNSMRQQMLGSFRTRMKNELFNRMLERSFNILLRAGDLGYVEGSTEAEIAAERSPNEEILIIPQEVVDAQESGEPFYKIKYTTPAEREQEFDAATGIMDVWAFGGEIAQAKGDMSVLNRLNADRSLKTLANIRGVPDDIMNDDKEVARIEKQQQEQQEGQEELESAQVTAGVAKDVAQAQALTQGA